jgi:hypothetical protein
LRWAGNFYRSETFTLTNQSPVSPRPPIFHSDENSAHELEARLDSAQVFVNERIRRSRLGETVLFRYNSKT